MYCICIYVYMKKIRSNVFLPIRLIKIQNEIQFFDCQLFNHRKLDIQKQEKVLF